jgi:hypothetical protein
VTAPAAPPIEVAPWKSVDRLSMGEQHVYRFANGYGASVIRGPYTYGGPEGLYELGVIAFDGDEWSLTYETPVTSDVLGHLSVSELAETLVRIATLPTAVAS